MSRKPMSQNQILAIEENVYQAERINEIAERYEIGRTVAKLCFFGTTKIMEDLGFQFVSTGGGFTAWCYDNPDGSFFMVTDEHGEEEAIVLDKCCLVGLYWPNGDYRDVDSMKLFDFVEAWKG